LDEPLPPTPPLPLLEPPPLVELPLQAAKDKMRQTKLAHDSARLAAAIRSSFSSPSV
jgi:hypothetical protein